MIRSTSQARLRRPALVSVLALGLVLGLAGTTLAGGFGPTVILRTAPAGRDLRAADMAANGNKLVVGWDETGPGGPASFMRWSTNGGGSFKPRVRLDDRPNREIQVDVCGGEAWAVSALHVPEDPPSEWLIVLDGRDLDGTGYEAGLLTFDGTSRYPDIACVGSHRLATTWLEKVGGSYHVMVYSRAVHINVKGDNPPEYSADLGIGTVGRGLAIAATSDRIVVAWFDGDDLKLKRYSVGGGPDYIVTPHAIQTLSTLQYGNTLELGIAGSRVVLAYTNRADLVVRVSANGGISFGAVTKLDDEPFPSEVAAFPTVVDIRGMHILVSGAVIGDAGGFLAGQGYTKESTNGGGAWSSVPGTTHVGGHSLSALVTRSGGEVIENAWDKWIDMPAVQKLRFHRQ